MSEADRYFIKKGFSKVIKQGIEEFTDDDGNYIHFDLVIERFTCNCYLSAKELQAINKKVEELRMDMSNKTSDKNVANIEEDIKYVKEMLEIARVFFKAVKAETNYKDVDDVAFCNAVEHILVEREQMTKRYEERDDELYERVKQCNNLQTEIDRLYLDKEELIELNRKQARQIQELEAKLEFKKFGDLDNVEFEEYMSQFIPKQVVIDKVNEINKKYEDSKDENGESPYYYPDFTIRVLQKLLGTK